MLDIRVKLAEFHLKPRVGEVTIASVKSSIPHTFCGDVWIRANFFRYDPSHSDSGRRLVFNKNKYDRTGVPKLSPPVICALQELPGRFIRKALTGLCWAETSFTSDSPAQQVLSTKCNSSRLSRLWWISP